MVPTHFQHMLSCTFFLFLFTIPFRTSSAIPYSDSPHHHNTDSNLSPPLFLKNLIGARKGSSAQGISLLKKYISKIGHGDDSVTNIHAHDDFFDDDLELSLISYQSYHRLVTNGVLDENTVEQLLRPRCELPDFGPFTSSTSSSEDTASSLYSFFPGSPKWPPTRRNLTYSFTWSGRNDLNKSISRALDVWAGVSPFRFTYTPDYDVADIKFSFRYRAVDVDRIPFDGPGGFFGRAFEPTKGRVQYDGDESWVGGVKQGAFDMQTVALHELGHVLGLGHTTNVESIMYPYIGPGLRKGLEAEDIAGIKGLYSS